MIKIENLCQSYQERLVLNNINIKLKKGDIYALIGHNGAGKSTTIKHILGLIKPESGSVLVNNINPYQETEKAREEMAYIPESLSLFPLLSAVENLRFFAKLAKIKLSVAQEEYLLNKVGLPQKQWQESIKNFSKGMKQKLAIAVALSKNANLLILDEPNSGLDPRASYELGLLLLELKNSGTTIFMVTHDMYCSHQVADEIGILQAGTLVKSINPKAYGLQDLQADYFAIK